MLARLHAAVAIIHIERHPDLHEVEDEIGAGKHYVGEHAKGGRQAGRIAPEHAGGIGLGGSLQSHGGKEEDDADHHHDQGHQEEKAEKEAPMAPAGLIRLAEEHAQTHVRIHEVLHP